MSEYVSEYKMQGIKGELQAEVERLRAERDEARAELSYMVQGYRDQKQRAERAEADAARLREALRGLTEESCREHCTGGRVHRNECIEARAALAGEEVE